MLILPRAEEVVRSRGIEDNPDLGALSLLDLVALTPVMQLTSGRPEIIIGLIDGPALTDHADFVSENIRTLTGKAEGRCARADSAACVYGTFVAGILCAKRDSGAPAICPGWRLARSPDFSRNNAGEGAAAERHTGRTCGGSHRMRRCGRSLNSLRRAARSIEHALGQRRPPRIR
jgi:hypothetical protein